MNDVLNDGVSEREGEEKNETSAGRSCFGNKNDGGMAEWNFFGNGKKWEVLNRGVSASGKRMKSC